MGHYKEVAGKYRPDKIKLLIVAEAPPEADENYFYRLACPDTDGRKRSFFCGIMKGVGLLPQGTKEYSEEKLLNAFLGAGYFLIDTCPKPLLVDYNKRPKEMEKYVPSLIQNIKEDLKPETVLFICKTNKIVKKRVHKEFPEKVIENVPLPYPGNGWLDRFIALFPEEYRLDPIY
jgi:hypothetical protein